MKGSLLWKFMYLFCAMAGILAGYGVFSLTTGKDNPSDVGTKDNTPVREVGDGVFFDAEKKDSPGSEISGPAYVTAAPVTPTPTMSTPITPVQVEPVQVEPLPVVPQPTEKAAPPALPQPTSAPADIPATPTVTVGVTATETPREIKAPAEIAEEPVQEPSTTQVITYPAKIFGQVPVLNPSDSYVSYFEFAYGLIAMLEPVVQAEGLNMNALLAKFAVKALLCGVDMEKLDINAPIPRRLAALCLWLAARVLNESGCDTSSKSAEGYVTDIFGCSASEKKAIAYLYETGILKGHLKQGQKFYPSKWLTTEEGAVWIYKAEQCWN